MVKMISAARAALVVAALSLLSGRASSQPSSNTNRAAAKAIYDDAVALMDQGKYSEACPKIEEALRLYPESLGAQVTRGDCYQEWGRFGTAVRAYKSARAAAAAAGDADREKKARERGEASAAKALKLTITVPDAVASLSGLVVKLDEEVVERSEWGAPVPVDAGTHQIEVTAPGKRAWTKTVAVEPSEVKAAVQVGPLEDAQDTLSSSSKTSVPSPLPGGADGSSGGKLRTAGFVVGAVGLAGAAVGSYFGLHSKSLRDESRVDGHCVMGNQCDAIGAPLLKDAVSAGNLSTGFFIAGAGLLAGGIVMLVVAPRAPAKPSVGAVLGPGRVELRGRW